MARMAATPPGTGGRVTWNWWVFLAGFLFSFLVSSLTVVGWYFLIILRHEKKDAAQIQRDFEQVRDSVSRAWRN